MTPESIPPSEPAASSVRAFLQRNLWRLVVTNAVLAAMCLMLLTGIGRRTGDLAGLLLLAVFLGCLIQLIAGVAALFLQGARLQGAVATLTAPVMLVAGLLGTLSGMGWGRPLRVRGKQVYPQLAQGCDWTLGEQPSPAGLDAPTRAALEALWLHDAQKEHASVPAFARISWLLAAVGAPAELMAWSQRAALEEVDHARRCFALAAGYGGRSHSVEAMPDLLLAGLEVRGDPLAVLAGESLQDGCQLEDFNADVAAACAAVCDEPVTRAVLQQIAREERSHAEFSWALLAWTLERSPATVRAAVLEAERALEKLPRPRAAGPNTWFLVARADAAQLLRHGRIPDDRLAALWQSRLEATRGRLRSLLAREDAARAA